MTTGDCYADSVIRYASTLQRFNNLTRRSHSSFARNNAFTLLELLIVISVIIVLAGLTIATIGYVQKKGARSRAEAEIAAMSAALESYKADNGVYPTDKTYTENVDPTASPIPATASLFLYEQLSGDANANRQPTGKSYFAFKPNMLTPPPPSTATVTAIRDPFGNPYGYSTIKAANPTGTAGFNPTFDLWSTAGTSSASQTDQAQWIKNW
jgi:type II secretory pathway pseudopilin PulG